jgi:hypothetical protein
MGKIYGSTKVCPENESTNCSYSLEPELSNIMAESEDYAERTYYWKVIKLGNILETFLMNHFIYEIFFFSRRFKNIFKIG